MNEDKKTTARHSLRLDTIRGMKMAFPLIVGYVPVAIAFGILGRVTHLPDWVTISMALFVYGGASQFAALQLIATGNIFSIILTTFIINSRHLLLAASIAPKIQGMNELERLWFGVELTDEAFAIHDLAYRNGLERSKWEIFVTNGAVHLSWVLATIIGCFCGSMVDGLSHLHLDFALTAMFIAILFIEVLHTKHNLLVAIISGIIAVLVTISGYGVWSTVVATIIAATIGWAMEAGWKTTSTNITELPFETGGYDL